jgi:hypothetical protein
MKNISKILGIGISFILLSFTPLVNEKTSSVVLDEALVSTCVPVTLSCGVSGDACGVSTEQIITQVEYAEEYWCGD